MLTKHLFFDGKQQPARNSSILYAPYSGEAIARVDAADEEETSRAIAAAFAARASMRALPAHRRAAILLRVAELLRERREEAARLIALEAAKPLRYAQAEVERTIQTYTFAAEEAKRIGGETIPLDAAPGGEGRLAYTMREPIGVVGAITPFNFPLNLVAHKVGPAIAAANTVVLKPAGQTPLSAYLIGELFHEAGLPAGALNIVTGSGAIVGETIAGDERIGKLSFTGSPEIGRRIQERAGLKRVTLELGSNSAVIVDNGVDVEAIVPRLAMGAFSNQGQICISLQNIYAHEAVYDALLSSLAAAASALRLGDPLDAATELTAMIAPSESERALRWIEEATDAGATVAAGGRLRNGMLEATVVADASDTMKVACAEAFAPIVVVHKCASADEAIARINRSRYGLQAGIYTSDLHTALRAADELQVGGVIINDIPTYRADHMPYGGVKESGLGREGVKYAIEEMTELKLVVINRNLP